MNTAQDILKLKNLDSQDEHLTGRIVVNLSELLHQKIPIPDGFVITTQAYDNFAQTNHLDSLIHEIKQNLPDKSADLKTTISKIQKYILSSPLNQKFEQQLIKHYLNLSHGWFAKPHVTVKTITLMPSGIDRITKSQNINGETNLILAVKQAWETFTTIQASAEQHADVAILVQLNPPTDVSGQLTTINTFNGDKNTLIIEALYGLQDTFGGQSETPDHYEYNKYSHSIVNKQINLQHKKLIYSDNQQSKIKIPKHLKNKQKLSDAQIIELAKLGRQIEHYYLQPQKITWGMFQNQFYVLETRPIETEKQTKSTTIVQKVESPQSLKILLEGISASRGIAKGYPQVVSKPQEFSKFKKGHVLVVSQPTKQFQPLLKKCSAIISDEGGQISDLAIMARDLGIPCVVGTESATKQLKHKKIITVDGNQGKIYLGSHKIGKFKLQPIKTEARPSSVLGTLDITKTATKLDVWMTNSQKITDYASMPTDGVGLISAETALQQIGTHPQHLIDRDKHYKLTDVLTQILYAASESFKPRPVLFQLSNFTTHDYHQLEWGSQYEQAESNPLLGYRGVLRHINHHQLTEIELQAIKNIRHKHNLRNLQLILPLVRSPKELTEIKKLLASSGLARSTSFQLWMTVSTPANVILLSEYYKKGIDGLVIDLDHLSQLIIGIDYQNEELKHLSKQSSLAIEWILNKILKFAHNHKLPTNVYSTNLTQKPDLIETLVQKGITRITVKPQTINYVRSIIAYSENRLSLAKV